MVGDREECHSTMHCPKGIVTLQYVKILLFYYISTPNLKYIALSIKMYRNLIIGRNNFFKKCFYKISRKYIIFQEKYKNTKYLIYLEKLLFLIIVLLFKYICLTIVAMMKYLIYKF